MKTLLLLTCLLFLPTPASAALCGPGQTNPICQCGDTVVGTYVMTAPLVCLSGHGLKLDNNAFLNCANFSITGVRAPGTYGIYFDSITNALAKNCVVSQFDRGVRFNGAFFNVLNKATVAFNGDTTLHTGYGVDFAGGSAQNVVKLSTIYGNADEGIHFGTGAVENTVSGCEVCGNFRESLYVLDGRDHVIQDTTAGHDCYGQVGGGNSLYLKDSVHTYLLRNTFNKVQVHVTGDARGTLLLTNIFNTTYKEDCYVPTGLCPTGTMLLP